MSNRNQKEVELVELTELENCLICRMMIVHSQACSVDRLDLFEFLKDACEAFPARSRNGKILAKLMKTFNTIAKYSKLEADLIEASSRFLQLDKKKLDDGSSSA